jgi:hypothetical protein
MAAAEFFDDEARGERLSGRVRSTREQEVIFMLRSAIDRPVQREKCLFLKGFNGAAGKD